MLVLDLKATLPKRSMIMGDDFKLTLTGGHIWLGPIPAHNLQRLKSFAMIGLKGFWADDLEEYSSYQFIPYDDGSTLSIETNEEDILTIFDEEYTLEVFPKIEFLHKFETPAEIKIPPELTLPQKLLDKIWQQTNGVDRYITNLEKEFSSPNGFSSISLGTGGFQAIIPIERDLAPKSIDEIYLVISKGSTKLGLFEYIHGVCINDKYYNFSDYDEESYCDLYHHNYYDEKFDFMCSFNQWFAGLDAEQIAASYISSVDDELIKVYISTDFQVNAEPTFILKIGNYSRGLSELHEQHNCETSAYITAWNPLGIAQTNLENKSRNNSLRKAISHKYAIIEGIGLDSDGKWSGEESFLILGINREDAMLLGKQFKQNTIVFNEDKIPELIMLE